MTSFTRNIHDLGLKKDQVERLGAVAKLIEMDGCQHTVHVHVAGAPGDDRNDTGKPYDVLAVLLNDSWADGTINTKALGLIESYHNLGKSVALVGVNRRRLSPSVQSGAQWIIY